MDATRLAGGNVSATWLMFSNFSEINGCLDHAVNHVVQDSQLPCGSVLNQHSTDYDASAPNRMDWTMAIQQKRGRFNGSREPCGEPEMNSVSEDRWYSVEEIASYLGIKRDTVYKWIDRKRMPAHKVGSLWKFRKEEIDDWVRSGEARDKRSEHGDDD